MRASHIILGTVVSTFTYFTFTQVLEAQSSPPKLPELRRHFNMESPEATFAPNRDLLENMPYEKTATAERGPAGALIDSDTRFTAGAHAFRGRSLGSIPLSQIYSFRQQWNQWFQIILRMFCRKWDAPNRWSYDYAHQN